MPKQGVLSFGRVVETTVLLCVSLLPVLQEFSEVLRKPELRSWMATLELETYDLVNLFHMIDDGCLPS